MTLELPLCLLLAAVCLIVNAVLAGGETALKGAATRLHALEASGERDVKALVGLLGQRERLTGAVLVGRMIALAVATGFCAVPALHQPGEGPLVAAVAGVIVTAILFGEVLPRALASVYSEQWAFALATPMRIAALLLGPLVTVSSKLVRTVLRLFGVPFEKHQAVLSAHEELRSALDLLHREGGVEKGDRDMLGGLLDLKELEVADVMVHRTKMRTIDADLPPLDIVREVLASPYTRMPLWRENPDNIVGVLHAKDLLRALDAAQGDASKLKVEELALETWFIPVTTSLPEQLKNFLAKKTHFALAVDEYGEVMGLVTLEDILEEIVGDIRDEHDLAVQGVRPQPDGSINLDGSVPIRDINRVMDWQLPDDNATTIAGLVIHEARAIPETNQVFTFHGFRFRVLRKRRNRITVVKVTPLNINRTVLPSPDA